MPYCSSEQKLQGYDEPEEIEVDSATVSEPEIDEENPLSVTAELELETRITLPCSGCGSEAAEGYVSATATFTHECPEGTEAAADDEVIFEADDSGADLSYVDRYQRNDRNGKRISNPRYQKRFRGFEGTVTVECSRCSMTFPVDIDGEDSASAFEPQSH